VSNRPNGTLYVGVTSDLARRAWEHRCGRGRQHHKAVRPAAAGQLSSITRASARRFSARGTWSTRGPVRSALYSRKTRPGRITTAALPAGAHIRERVSHGKRTRHDPPEPRSDDWPV